MLAAGPWVCGALLLGPVAVGLAGVVALAGPGVAGVLAWPGLGTAVRLSVTTGMGATVISLIIVALLMAAWSGTRPFRWFERALAPLLSIPHSAAAFGFAALLAPSGWIARIFSPWLTGWDRPPDLLILNDPAGLAMTLGLVVKEVPFLLFMTLSALGQSEPRARTRIASSLSYGRIKGWLVAVFPSVYRQLRLPVYVVLAYSMTVIDVALVLGPTTPPPLSVQVLRWMSDPTLGFRDEAAAAALLQLGLVAGAMALWRVGEMLVARLGLRWAVSGTRAKREAPLRAVSGGLGLVVAGIALGGLVALFFWSVAAFWPFPDAIPGWSMKSWARHAPALAGAGRQTAVVAGVSVLIGLVLTLWLLEAVARRQVRLKKLIWVIYVPLVVPQAVFLPGLQVAFLHLGADRGLFPVALAHLAFVFPYMILALADPYAAFDQRITQAGASLGASPWAQVLRLKWPMLLRPILTAAAIGGAVSIGQYLPTVLMGGGRVQTLTTEAVALASGGDLRAIGVFAIVLAAAAFGPFALAAALPRAVFYNRRAMRHDSEL